MTAKWNYEDEWFEETNVARKIKKYLLSREYKITKFNESKWQKGHDIEAIKQSQKSVIEVKGYPSDKYVRGKKKGLIKPTDPKLQAKHGFSEALLSLLIAKSDDRRCKIAIGLPRFQVYEDLLAKLKPVIEKLKIGILLVKRNGNVDAMGL